MSDEWMELSQRLVVSRKRDGRCVYDEQAKLDRKRSSNHALEQTAVS